VGGTADHVALSNLALTMGDVRITGAGDIAVSRQPAVTLDLSVNHLDVADWRFPDASVGPSPAAWLLGQAGPVAFPRGVTLAIDAEIGALTAGGAPIRQVRLDALLGDGVVSVSRLTAQLPGGSDLRGV